MALDPARMNHVVDYREYAQVLYARDVFKTENESLRGQNGVLSERTRALSEENERLRQDSRSLRRAVEIKSLECHELRNEAKGLSQRLQLTNPGTGWSFSHLFPTTRSDNKSTETETAIAELQKKVAKYEQKIKDLETENSTLRRETAEQKKSMQLQTIRFAKELEDIRSKDTTRALSLSDTDIEGKWNALGFSVRQFVSVHLPETLDAQIIQRLSAQEEFSWLPEMTTALQVSWLCPLLLQSWVWHNLCLYIFDSHSTVWAGEEGEIFGGLCDRIRGRLSNSSQAGETDASIAKFHDWRVRSAHFISSLADRNQERVIKREAKRMLYQLQSVKTHGEISEQMYRDAQRIIHKATELAEFFRLAKADFQVFITRVKPPQAASSKSGFQFDQETMEVKNIPASGPDPPAPFVDLVIAPGIIKAGSADGTNYNTERVLVKLQALCNLRSMLERMENGRAH